MVLALGRLIGAFVRVEHRDRRALALGDFILVAHGGGDAGHGRSDLDEPLQDLFALVHGGLRTAQTPPGVSTFMSPLIVIGVCEPFTVVKRRYFTCAPGWPEKPLA